MPLRLVFTEEINLQITIHLSDVNDEKPVFVRQASGECASVSEFLNPGETVLSISATDKDEPGSLNSRLVFSMDIDQVENGESITDIDPQGSGLMFSEVSELRLRCGFIFFCRNLRG